MRDLLIPTTKAKAEAEAETEAEEVTYYVFVEMVFHVDKSNMSESEEQNCQQQRNE